MKVQVYTAVVVMGVLAMGAAQPTDIPPLLRSYLLNATADLCGSNGCTGASHCFEAMKLEPITTQEELDVVKDDLSKCAETVGATNADFSGMTLQNINPPTPRKRPFGKAFGVAMFMRKYGVEQGQVIDMMKCMVNRDGSLDTLRACLVESQSSSDSQA